MLPFRSGILAEAINTKILTKNHTDSQHSHPDSPHSPHSQHSQPIPRIPTLIPRVPTVIPRVPIIPLIPFPDSLFRLLQITYYNVEMKRNKSLKRILRILLKQKQFGYYIGSM